MLSHEKWGFIAYTDNEGPDQTAHAQSDQGLHCPLLESADRVKCIDKQEMLDCAHAQANLGIRYAHMAY